jgi:hypothetical protein
MLLVVFVLVVHLWVAVDGPRLLAAAGHPMVSCCMAAMHVKKKCLNLQYCLHAPKVYFICPSASGGVVRV